MRITGCLRIVSVSLCFLMLSVSIGNAQQTQQTITQYLSGTDKDHTVTWDFFCTKGRKSGSWTSIAVPSCWEQQGFGTYIYSKDIAEPEQGLYKHSFKLSPVNKNKKVFIVFDGSMTDTEVKINGKSAGDIHQGGFYQFKYDITELVQFDKPNTLEVTVSRHSTNESVNRAERKADFWLFGGIYRPVFLEIVPQTFIERVAIDAQMNGDFNLQVFSNISNKQSIEAQVYDLSGKAIDLPFGLQSNSSNTLSHHFNQIKTWNPEQPNLYKVEVRIKENNKTVHSYTQRFGFRTTELRLHDGFYVNNVKVIFKGVCRHSEWPESGRTLSRDICLNDIRLIKEMNMNAVRMSHYPPDRVFLNLCDSLGLFVLDELTGWQASYDTTVGRKLVKELVVRDVNHPSIVIWDNGNEGGWNRGLDNDYALYDPQKRIVIHPWEKFNGTNTKHYPDFKYVQNEVATGTEVFFPTEFMHGLFDGGHGAALDDFWNEMMKSPRAAGGFLWSFHDEGLMRTDNKDSMDVAGNLAPDGIVGPHREKEGSFYTIKEIWSPVAIANKNISADFDQKLTVTNHYLYTNLNKCSFGWKLIHFGEAGNMIASTVISKGTAATLSLAPNETGMLHLNMGKLSANADALYVSAFDPSGKEIFTWSWPLHSPKQLTDKLAAVSTKQSITTNEKPGIFELSCNGITYSFDTKTGFLQDVFNGKKHISFSNGPSLAGVTLNLTDFKSYKLENKYFIEPVYAADNHFTVQWVFENGKLPKLNYQYSIAGEKDFTGITFTYPEEKINGLKWLGRGPYHVWKNRLKGLQLNVWQKKYNDTHYGESWIYPEFKGWHSEMYWATIQNKESDFTVYTENENVYLQMLQIAKAKASPNNNNTAPAFPGNTIGFFNSISPIGTKFQAASLMGPASQKNIQPEGAVFSGSLLFDFR